MDGMREEERLEEVAGEVNPIYASVGCGLQEVALCLRERGREKSTPRYFLLHMVANEENISQGQVGHLSGVDPSRVTQVAKSLERDGLIQRHPRPEGQSGRSHAPDAGGPEGFRGGLCQARGFRGHGSDAP